VDIAAPVAPLAPHSLLLFLLQVAVLLTLALCLGRLAARFGMPAICGELLAGVIVGPSILGAFAPGAMNWLMPADPGQVHMLDATGQLGVLLLVGLTGAQLDLSMVKRRTGTAIKISMGGLLIPLILGVGLGFVLPASLFPAGTERVAFAVMLGVAMCVTAIPVIAKTLSDMKLLHRDVGQLTLAAGMIDDAVGWFLLSVVSAMVTVGVRADQVGLSVAILIGFVLVAMFLLRPVVRKLMQSAANSTDSTPSVALAVVLILLGASASHALGMEPIFGAFIAGILIGSKYASKLAPLRTIVMSVLAPIFLASAGLRMDLTALADPEILLFGLLVLFVAIFGKFVGAYLGARSSKLSKWEGLALGAGMNARGVVEVVVAMSALRLGVFNTATYTIVVLVAIVTSLMAPPLLRFSMRRVEANADEELRRVDQEQWLTPQREVKPDHL
jgi:Kef-type K+ transport system membrane component KefB